MPEGGGPAHVSRKRTEKSPQGRKLELLERKQRQEAKKEKKRLAAEAAADAAAAAAADPAAAAFAEATDEERKEFTADELVFRSKFKALIGDLGALKKLGKVSENAIRPLMESWKVCAEIESEDEWNEVVDGWKEHYEEAGKIVDAIKKAGVKYLEKDAKQIGGQFEADEEG